MIITFEGLSCAGKTAMSSYLERTYPEQYSVVPEFILPLPDVITTSFCKENDLAKAELAKQHSTEGKVALMDRGWLSTVVYEYAAHGEDDTRLITYYAEQFERGKLPSTDLYIYLRIEAADAIARAKSVDRFNNRYAWYFAPEFAVEKYDQLFSSQEIAKNAVVLDAMSAFELLAGEIHKLATKGVVLL